jgi:predicted LPLAT superfamily acyltransferase
VRVVSPICCGDIITISNLGSFTLAMAASNTQGGYNVNILIERYN